MRAKNLILGSSPRLLYEEQGSDPHPFHFQNPKVYYSKQINNKHDPQNFQRKKSIYFVAAAKACDNYFNFWSTLKKFFPNKDIICQLFLSNLGKKFQDPGWPLFMTFYPFFLKLKYVCCPGSAGKHI